MSFRTPINLLPLDIIPGQVRELSFGHEDPPQKQRLDTYADEIAAEAEVLHHKLHILQQIHRGEISSREGLSQLETLTRHE